MRFAAFAIALALSFMLLLPGCIIFGGQEKPAAPASNQTQEPAPVFYPTIPQVQPPTTPAPVNSTPSLSPESCTVGFQKDEQSNIFYVLVKTDTAGEVTVACPNGRDGSKRGSLYYCDQLDSSAPAIAYIDGLECGRAQFANGSGAPVTNPKQSCSISISSTAINSGQSVTVNAKAYVPQKSVVSYKCGETDITFNGDGFIDRAKVCTFTTTGNIEVYVKIDGVVCASKYLSVG